MKNIDFFYIFENIYKENNFFYLKIFLLIVLHNIIFLLELNLYLFLEYNLRILRIIFQFQVGKSKFENIIWVILTRNFIFIYYILYIYIKYKHLLNQNFFCKKVFFVKIYEDFYNWLYMLHSSLLILLYANIII